jgi:hypothetical protein
MLAKTPIKILISILSVVLFVFVYNYHVKIFGHIPVIYNYFQPINAKYLSDTNQTTRVMPHRVNSIGKLDDIWQVGFRSFECDVRFGDNAQDRYVLGHDFGDGGVDFEDLLLSKNYKEIKKIWLDFKNLDKDNYIKALDVLNNLDKKYSLKNKLIVESGTKGEFFKVFYDSGYHTSYYTPTSLIKKLLKQNDTDGMHNLADNIAKQVKAQHTSAVSFYHEIYPFIKEYLEPLLPNDVVYHIWYAPALYDNNFKANLLKNKLYLDKRVKTLLSTYRSKYDM